MIVLLRLLHCGYGHHAQQEQLSNLILICPVLLFSPSSSIATSCASLGHGGGNNSTFGKELPPLDPQTMRWLSVIFTTILWGLLWPFLVIAQSSSGKKQQKYCDHSMMN